MAARVRSPEDPDRRSVVPDMTYDQLQSLFLFFGAVFFFAGATMGLLRTWGLA